MVITLKIGQSVGKIPKSAMVMDMEFPQRLCNSSKTRIATGVGLR
uniref:Uncharacterized protein n=1 Tax=viral metagenome TaxID=1070528 RepID=A0A6C0EBQ4_9ZZZZ